MSNSMQMGMHEDQPFIALSDEADRLRREHGELKVRLSELNSRLHLTPSEELERKTLQKMKLAKKDRLAALMVNYTGQS